jgi:tRNA(fMet)-specific endonuclease VapC
MSRYILDTDCFSLWQQNHPMMVQRVEVNAENLAVTIVTVEEVIRGWFNVINQASAPSQADKLVWGYTRLWDTLDDFKNLNILKFDQNASTIYTEFHRQIRRIGTQDLRIAAIVLANNAILVTRNNRDFSQVPDLVQEDWTIQP